MQRTKILGSVARQNVPWPRFAGVAGLVCIVVAALAACVVYEDECVGVACGEGEVCIDLAAGPRCVCDDFHETTDTGCVPFEEGSDG
jgi:hypothetical protein